MRYQSKVMNISNSEAVEEKYKSINTRYNLSTLPTVLYPLCFQFLGSNELLCRVIYCNKLFYSILSSQSQCYSNWIYDFHLSRDVNALSTQLYLFQGVSELSLFYPVAPSICLSNPRQRQCDQQLRLILMHYFDRSDSKLKKIK